MAITISGNRFTNSQVGRPSVGNDISIYANDATPKYPVGFGFDRSDGNRYRYCQFATAVSSSMVVATKMTDVARANTLNAVIAPASAVAVGGDNIAPGNAGSYYLEFTQPSISANQLQGNYMIVNGGTGLNYTYRIKGNTATGNPASGNIRIQLYEPIQVSLAADSDIVIMGSPYNNLIAATAGTDLLVVGVSQANITAGYWGWICEHGLTGVLCATACTTGYMLIVGNTAGYVTTLGITSSSDVRGTPIIGKSVVDGGAGLAGAIWIDVA